MMYDELLVFQGRSIRRCSRTCWKSTLPKTGTEWRRRRGRSTTLSKHRSTPGRGKSSFRYVHNDFRIFFATKSKFKAKSTEKRFPKRMEFPPEKLQLSIGDFSLQKVSRILKLRTYSSWTKKLIRTFPQTYPFSEIFPKIPDSSHYTQTMYQCR